MAFLSGAAMGAVAALLLAPQSGSDRATNSGLCPSRREDLRDLAGRAGEAFEEVADQGKEFIETKRSGLREAFDAGREAVRRERGRIHNEEPERG